MLCCLKIECLLPVLECARSSAIFRIGTISVAKNSTTTWRILLGLLAVLRGRALSARLELTRYRTCNPRRHNRYRNRHRGPCHRNLGGNRRSVIRLLPDDHKGSAISVSSCACPPAIPCWSLIISIWPDVCRCVRRFGAPAWPLRMESERRCSALDASRSAGNHAGGWIEYRDRRYE